MMGAIIDRTHSKEGKFRFWLKYMSVPGMVIVALCFFVPELTTTGKIIWVAVTYVLALVPYEAGAAVQPESVCNLFFYESTLIPGLIYAATLIFALLMRKYEKRIPQMQKEIEERKQKQNT